MKGLAVFIATLGVLVATSGLGCLVWRQFHQARPLHQQLLNAGLLLLLGGAVGVLIGFGILDDLSKDTEEKKP